MLWSTALSDDPDLSSAVDTATAKLLSQVGGQPPDLVIAFLSESHRDRAETLPSLIEARLEGSMLIGCSAGGVIGDCHEIEEGPGLTLTGAILPNVTLEPFHIDAASASRLSGGAAWNETLAVPASENPVFLLIAEPFSTDIEPVLESLDRCYPGSAKIGGLASGAKNPGEAFLYLRRTTHDSGLAGIALHGDVAAETVVAQGCRPIGDPMFVTRAEGNLLYEIDGHQPSKVLRALMESCDESDRQLARHSLFLGLAMRGERERYAQGDYLIRNIVGFDPESEAIAVAANLQGNSVVQFHLRDADASAADLESMLSGYATRKDRMHPAGALLFSCLGRGRHLYGEPNHDSRVFRRYMGNVPLGGFFCNGEIGPVQGRTFLHGYTSAFGLFSKRGASTPSM